MIYTQTGIYTDQDATDVLLGASFQYGLTPFETVRVYSSENKPNSMVSFELKKHISRLFRTLGHLDIVIKFRPLDVEQRILDIIKTLNTKCDYIIKVLVYTKESSWGAATEFDMLYIVKEAKRRSAGERPASLLTTAQRRPRVDVTSVKTKVGSNYISSRTAQRLTNKLGYDLPLYLNDTGLVAESSGAALIYVKDDIIYIPETLGSSLESITLNHLIKAAEHEQIATVKKFVSLPDLYDADGLFLIGTTVETLSISRLDHVMYDLDLCYAFSEWCLNKIQHPQKYLSEAHKEVACG